MTVSTKSRPAEPIRTFGFALLMFEGPGQRSAKMAGVHFLLPVNYEKFSSTYSSIFDIFDLNVRAGSFSHFCRGVFYELFM